MRILNVTAQKPDSTGSGTYLAETVRCEEELGHRTAVVCGVSAGDAITSLPVRTRVWAVRFDTPELPFHVCGMSDVMPYPATRYHDLTPRMTSQFEQAFLRTIREAVGEFHPDLVICHHLYLVTSLVREVVRDRPVVGLCHSTDLRQLGQHGLERERITRDVRRLDRVLALHDVQAQQIRRVLGVESSRIRVVGTGYNAGVFHPDERVARVPGRLVYAGKVWRKKGVVCLLHALRELAGATAGLSLHLAGGWTTDEAERQEILGAAAGCSSGPHPADVEFLGRLPQPRLADEYRAAQTFVLPSFYEGLPLVAIEAMASGCRVVMTDLPGIRPWVEQNVPDAPVRWVRPPRMRSVDEPLAEDLPAFEGRLAQAIGASLGDPAPRCDLAGVSWEAVTCRILAASLGR